jgi:hypothetical protein
VGIPYLKPELVVKLNALMPPPESYSTAFSWLLIESLKPDNSYLYSFIPIYGKLILNPTTL